MLKIILDNLVAFAKFSSDGLVFFLLKKSWFGLMQLFYQKEIGIVYSILQ